MSETATPSAARSRRRSTAIAAFLASVLATGALVAVTQFDASAAESSPVGYASMNGGTTGGSAGTVVTVTTSATLKAALNADTSQTIRVSGMIATAGLYNVKSNKTIIGVGSSSGITGGALNLNGVRNVIIRNLVFRDATGDSINVQNGTTNVWIDHNDLSNGGDGLIDITHGTDFITVSWNRLHNHDKSMLLGHDDANASEDTGHLRVTYVQNVANPTLTNTGESDAGNIKVLNNYKVNSGTEQTRNAGSVAAIPYSYTPEANNTVKATVMAGAGVGKI